MLVGFNMNRLCAVLFSLPLFFCFFQTTEGVSGKVFKPANPALTTMPNATRKCFVFQWTAGCESNDTICRTTVKLTTRQGNGVSGTISKVSFIPPTGGAGNKTHYLCVYDSGSEQSTCCSEVSSVAGLRAQAMADSLDKAEKVEFDVKNCLNYSGNCVSDVKPFAFVVPWKNPCSLSKPCGLYGACQTTKPNEYNCSCLSDWEGANCTVLKGFSTFKDKCFASSVDVITTASPKTISDCVSDCKKSAGCRSFVFIPDKADSKTGKCTLYKSTSKDYKLESCPGKSYYEMAVVPTTQPSGAAVTGLFYPLCIVAIVNMIYSLIM